MKPIEESFREFADHVAAFVDELPDGEYKGLGRLRLMLKNSDALLAQPTGDAAAGDTLWQECGSLVEKCRDKTPDKWDFAWQLEQLCKKYHASHVAKADAVAAERERCASHYPTTKSDATETWLVCSCGWSSGPGFKPWKEGWQEHIRATGTPEPPEGAKP